MIFIRQQNGFDRENIIILIGYLYQACPQLDDDS